VRVGPLLELMLDWRSFIEEDITGEEMEGFRLHEQTGRPLGDKGFVERIEKLACRVLGRGKPGPRKKDTKN
jgi:putative transposase